MFLLASVTVYAGNNKTKNTKDTKARSGIMQGQWISEGEPAKQSFAIE